MSGRILETSEGTLRSQLAMETHELRTDLDRELKDYRHHQAQFEKKLLERLDRMTVAIDRLGRRLRAQAKK